MISEHYTPNGDEVQASNGKAATTAQILAAVMNAGGQTSLLLQSAFDKVAE